MSLETSLPPLPTSGKSGSNLNISDGVELPPLQDQQSVNEGEQDNVLQNHFLRVQEAVLNSADAKIKEMSTKLLTTQALLKETKEEKDDAGIALYRSRKEITHLNKLITKNRAEHDQIAGDKAILSQQLQAATTSLGAAKVENHDLVNAMKEIQRKYEESQLKILHLRDINTNYTSEIKIQKQINSKLKKEMEVVSEKAKSMEQALEKERAKTEELFTNGRTLEGLLSQQQAEVRAAKAAIETLHKDNNLLEKTRGATEKQWEDSLIAMSGRDKAIQSMQDHKQTILTKLSESEVANRVYKAEQASLQARLSKKEQECDQLSQMNAQLKTELKDINTKLEENIYDLNQARYAEKSFAKEAEELSKVVEGQEKEIQSKLHLIATLKDKIKNYNLGLNDTEKFKIDIEEAAKREDRIQEAAEEKMKKIKREGESKNVTIRYDLATLQIEFSKKEAELFNLQKAYDTLKEQNQDLNRHYLQLHESSKEMAYCLERKDHDMNLVRAKSDALAQDHKKVFDTLIVGLQTEVKTLKAEKEQLKTLWLESQKQLTEDQAKFSRLDHENSQLHTKLGIIEGVKQKTGNELKNSKEESLDHKQEAAKLFNELKKMQPIIVDLQEKNKILEHKLHEAELKLEESNVNHTTTKQMLRTEIRRLSQDRSNLRQDKAEYDRSVMHIERNTLLYKEMIEKLKAEKYELQKNVFDLKRRADEADKKYFDIKMKLRQIEKVEIQKAEKRMNSQSKLDSQGKWKSFASMDTGSEIPPSENSTTGSNSEAPKNSIDKVIQDIPDFDGMRLRMESLSSEKEFLINENSILNNRLVKLNAKYEDLQKSYVDAKKQVKDLTVIRAEQIERIGVLDKRYNRAKKVAAHMEKQLKEGRPNAKIDYMMIGNADPSTQLLASLMTTKETKPAHLISLPENVMMPTASYNRRTTMTAQKSSKQLI